MILKEEKEPDDKAYANDYLHHNKKYFWNPIGANSTQHFLTGSHTQTLARVKKRY